MLRFLQKDTDTFFLSPGFSKYNHASLYNNASLKIEGGLLLKTSDGFYFLYMGGSYPAKYRKIKKVLAYNVNTKHDEDFDLSEFKYFGLGICVYRNRLFVDNYPVYETIDVKKSASDKLGRVQKP